MYASVTRSEDKKYSVQIFLGIRIYPDFFSNPVVNYRTFTVSILSSFVMDFIIAKFKMVRASVIYKMNLTNLTHFLRGRTFSGREAVPLAPSSFTSR